MQNSQCEYAAQKTLDKLESIAGKLAESNSHLIGIVGDVSRLSERVEKLEGQIDSVKKKVWRIGGMIIVIGMIAPAVVTYLIGLVTEVPK